MTKHISRDAKSSKTADLPRWFVPISHVSPSSLIDIAPFRSFRIMIRLNQLLLGWESETIFRYFPRDLIHAVTIFGPGGCVLRLSLIRRTGTLHQGPGAKCCHCAGQVEGPKDDRVAGRTGWSSGTWSSVGSRTRGSSTRFGPCPATGFYRRTQRQAYDDESIPIGEGQTITPPYDVAFMTEVLDPKPTDRVYEVGTDRAINRRFFRVWSRTSIPSRSTRLFPSAPPRSTRTLATPTFTHA